MSGRHYGSWTGSDTPAVYGLVVIMLVFFLVGFFVPGLAQELVIWLGWLITPAWLHELRFWQMITYPLIHGDPISLLFDGLVIFFLGGSLERAWGTARFIAFFFLSGIVAGFTVLLLTFLIPSVVPAGFFLGQTVHFVSLGVAFGAINPYARIYIYFVLPIEGRWLGVISAVLELFFNAHAYGGPIGAVIAIGVTGLFSWYYTRGLPSFPRGGGPGLKDRFERWQQRQRMRAWQRKVSKIDKPEDLFKDR